MRIFLSISISLLAVSIVSIVTNTPEPQKTINENKLIVKVESNRLLTGILRTYGILPAMSNSKPLESVVNSDTPDVEQISIGTKEIMEWSLKGRMYSLIRNEAQIGSLGIGVFLDPNEALRVYLDAYFHTSIIPVEMLDKELGNRSARWRDERHNGFRRILFLRDNVIVNVYLASLEKFIKMGGDPNTAIDIAKAIDKALVEGTFGVQRGSFLKIPRIVAVDTPKELLSRSRVDAKVRIALPENPQDPNSKDTEVVRTLPFYVPGVSPDERSEENRTFTYEVTYISPACVVTSKQVKLIVKPSRSSVEEKSN